MADDGRLFDWDRPLHGALPAVHPVIADTMAALHEGSLQPVGNLVPLWVDCLHVEVVDRVYIDLLDTVDVCADCGAYMAEGVAECTCEGEWCPDCWSDCPRPEKHPDC